MIVLVWLVFCAHKDYITEKAEKTVKREKDNNKKLKQRERDQELFRP